MSTKVTREVAQGLDATAGLGEALGLTMQQRAAFRGPGQIVRSASANKTPCLQVRRAILCIARSKSALNSLCAQVRRGAVFSQITSGGTSQPAEDPAHWEAQKTCLWDRQDQLWTRELQRWDDERRQWDKREEAMQQRIKTLEVSLLSIPLHRTGAM